MWNETFVLADRIKGVLFAWIAALVAIATAADVAGYADAAMVPLTIIGLVAQTYIVTAALRVGLSNEAQAAISPQFGRVFVISLVSGLGILVGGLFLVIPGVFLLLRWWVAVPLALDRGLSVDPAMRDSWRMTAPHWASILGLFLGLLAMLVFPMVALFYAGAFDEETPSLVMAMLINLVTYGVTNLGSVSSVAVYRTIDQTVPDLRSVFE